MNAIRYTILILSTLMSAPCLASPALFTLSSSEAKEIGNLIWRNECAGSIQGLTSWNHGEEFASVGIGHFVWCFNKKTCPFEEAFPSFLSFIKKQGISTPLWLRHNPACPWRTRESFLKDQQTPRMKELRDFLVKTIPQQTAYMVYRLKADIAHIITRSKNPSHVRKQFIRLTQTKAGKYALVDYRNFKGSGLSLKERYNHEGWGLMQVLESMHGFDQRTAIPEFVSSAKLLLDRRIKNSPKERNEHRWRPGWFNRLDSYQAYARRS